MHGQLWLVEDQPKKGDLKSTELLPIHGEGTFIRIAGCHPALIAFMIGVSAN